MIWLRTHREPLFGLVLFGAGLVLALATRSYVVQVLGTAAALAGLALGWRSTWPLLDRPAYFPLWRRGSGDPTGPGAGSATKPSSEPVLPWTWQRVAWEAFFPLFLFALVVVLYHPLLGGHFPWQADHTVHLQKAWLLSEQLLPSGRIFGWTHQSGTGYPAETLYPPLGDLYLAALRYGTFKQLSLGATYALGLFGVITFGVLSFYYLGRRLFGPLAGCVAGFLVLTDPGGFREGGYVFTIQYGVWPLHLGIVLAFLALVKFFDYLEGPGWRHLGRFSLALGAALLAHPVTLIFFLVALPLMGLFVLWRRPPGSPPLLGRALGGIALGVGLAAFWLLPFVTKASGFSAHVTNYWKAIPDIAEGLLGANLWQGAWAWPAVTGGLGALLALRERRPVAGFLVALAAALLLAASLTTFTELRLGDWLASARFVQFQRLVIFVKLIAFLLAGYLAQRIFFGLTAGALDARAEEPGSLPTPPLPTGWRRHLRLGVVTLLVAPFVAPVGWRLAEDRILPVSGLTYERDKGSFVGDLRAVLGHLCAESKEPGTPFFRVAYLSSFNDHEMASASTYCPLREVKLSFIPSETFLPRAHLQPHMVPRTAEDFRALNVRYVVGNSTQAVPAFLRPVMRRGRVTLHEVPDYQPEPFTVLCPQPEETTGAAPDPAPRHKPAFDRALRPMPPGAVDVKVTRFSDEEIRVQAGQVPSGCSLVLHVAHFANWRAQRGSLDLPIRAHDLTPRVRGLMRIPLEPGVTVFSYARLPVDWLAWAITLLTLLLFGLRFGLRYRPGLRETILSAVSPWVVRLGRPARLAALALGILLAALVLFKALGTRAPADRPRSLIHELSSARVSIAGGEGRTLRCTTFQMGRWICGKGRRWVGPVAEEWNLKNRLGIWAHPDEAGPLVIELPSQRLGGHMEIDYGILQTGGAGAPVTLEVFIDNAHAGSATWPRAPGPAGWAPAPLLIDTSARRGQRANLRFSVTAPNIGGRHFAFHPRIVP